MKIYLVHPGESDSKGLTAKGTLQLQSLARRFSNDNLVFDKIYVNGNISSRSSGDILSRSLFVPIISDERFVEIDKRVVLGDISENDVENLENINLFIDNLVSKGKNALITIGGGIHRVVISKLTGMPLLETRHFSLTAGGVSVLEYGVKDGTGKWRIKALNDLSHLRIP